MSADLSILKGAKLAFDLDGTLVDTAPDLVRALNASIAADGLGPVPLNDVRAMVGRGASALIERAYQREGRDIPTGQAFSERLDHFLTSYRADLTCHSVPFEGVQTCLETFHQHGAELSVCTNKPTHLSIPLLEQLDMHDSFVRVIGPEDAPAKKPDPRHIETATGAKADAHTIMIGDSEPDALAAQYAGAGLVLFEGGYSEKPVSTLGADRLFSVWADLPPLIAGLIAERLDD